MANNNNIQHFTAADIEKYHKGLLSNKERNALEKAALEDPFLADALEGYNTAGVNVANDIAELKKKLAERSEGAKIIPMTAHQRNSFKPLRAAVLILFVAGASFLIYQFGFNKKQEEIAQVNSIKKADAKISDTTPVNNSLSGTVTTETKTTDGIKNGPADDKNVASNNGETKPAGNIATDAVTQPASAPKKIQDNEVITNQLKEAQPVAAPSKVAEEKTDFAKDKIAGKREIAKQEDAKAKTSRQETEQGGARDQGITNKPAANRRADDQYYRNQNQSNVFRGRVTDADNNGVPFANVTNLQDNNAGTYTDARGNFNLTYPDSVLTVQVRSVGFENTNVQLRNSTPTNQVVMHDDRKNLSEVIVSNQKPNAAGRSRDANMKLEEPEPADGWDNYDVYLANNVDVPDDVANKQTGTGQVQVSFEVNKDGQPTNIKIVKSLCTSCDKEAIRLIKDGPKWKRNAKKGRTTITINF